MKKKLVIIGIPLTILFFLCLLCSGVFFLGYYQGKGSGEVEQEARDIEDFNRIILEGQGKIILEQGESTSLEVKADDNILKRIQTEVSDDELTISYKKEFPFYWGDLLFPSEDIIYYITIQDLTKIQIKGTGQVESDFLDLDSLEIIIDGAGEIKLEEFYAQNLKLSINGTGDIEIEGEVDSQEIDINGAGQYKALDLNSEDCEISVDGAGDAQVYATNFLKVTINGAGEVKYDGNPDEIEKHISGLGKLSEI